MTLENTVNIGSFAFPVLENVSLDAWESQLQQGYNLSQQKTKEIVEDTSSPTLSNTIFALESLSRDVGFLTDPFFAVTSAHTTPEVEEMIEKWSTLFSNLSTQVFQDERLYRRIQQVQNAFEQDSDKCLSVESLPKNLAEYPHLKTAVKQMLDDALHTFKNSGVSLPKEQKERLVEINSELIKYYESFNRSNQKNSGASAYLSEDEVDGISDEVKAEAFDLAEKQGRLGEYAFASQPMFVETLLPSMTNRQGRQRLVDACLNRGLAEDTVSTKNEIVNIMKLREEKSKLLGFENPSYMLLDQSMATPSTALKLLEDTWAVVKPAMNKDLDMLKQLAQKDGVENLSASDLVYYTEKYRQENYALNEREVSEYLSLPTVRKAAFEVASRLFNISFEPVEVPLYVEDAKAYLVKNNETQEEVGIFIVDDHMRPEKRSGAWMTDLRGASYMDGERVLPWVMNVCNFEKNKEDRPALLTLEDAVTVFHELGHGLHSLLTQVPFPSLAGTSVARDFVELPSQILENWIRSPESLKMFAKHYKTGESIPDELVEKIEQASKFGVAIDRSRYLFSSFLDLKLHQSADMQKVDVDLLEQQLREELGFAEQVFPRHRMHHFGHIFSDSAYASSYYCYLWAEVLEASAFALFKEKGLFNKEKAKELKTIVFETGGSVPSADLFAQLTGKDFNPRDLLERDGLIVPVEVAKKSKTLSFKGP